jgi:hypothetical protein
MATFPSLAPPPLTRNQRWANMLVVVVAVVGLSIGLLIKNQAVSSTVPFRDLAAGILAQYPERWLLDTGGEYVFRVQDPESPGFRTTLQVDVVSIGEDAAARNIIDTLTLERAQTLAAYRILRNVPYTLPDGESATYLDYAFVSAENNPFLESLPVVVRGVDIISIKRGQAIVVTFRVEADQFDEEFWRLEQFLASLEF